MSSSEKNTLLAKALATSVLQLQGLNEYGQQSKDKSSKDFMKMIHVEKQVIKIQSHFRRLLAVKKQEKVLYDKKALLARKEAAKRNISNEEIVLHEFKTRLAKKNMTPEAFFRTCDTDYKRSVPTEKFK